MRRLFSTFARGWPGVGLLLLRVVAGIALLWNAFPTLLAAPQLAPAILQVLAGAAGILLILGLWTPLAGAVVTIIEVWNAFSQAADPLLHIILGSLGAALALLGPGIWSVDARLFGVKRINLSDPKR